MNCHKIIFLAVGCFLLGTIVLTHPAIGKNICDLSQHFNEPGVDISPWIFVPKENIKEASTAEHPGLFTIYPAGEGKDIKGILKQPIRIDEYRLPWEFQLGLAQNFDAMCGVGSKNQSNYALGLNLAVTFSDPSTWPDDRTERPAETHDLQLLVVHLGHNSGGVGLPQYTLDPSPETYMVWGRGNLDSNVTGNWNISYVWVGDGSSYAGPASYQLYYRCVILSPTQIQVGIKFDASHGWNMRNIDCSQFGKITGIWEIGPIFSHDRWIPDVLCPSLPKFRVYPIITGVSMSQADFLGVKSFSFPQPKPEPPNPGYEDYVDYCVFRSGKPIPFEQYSDDFNIPGYMGKWQIQPQSTYADTYSNPGHLTITLVGVGVGTGFGPVDAADYDLKAYPPSWEIETCFNAPDDSIPWNYYLSMVVYDKEGLQRGFWNPGVTNDPIKKKHSYLSVGGKSLIDVTFDPEVPESILAAKPLYMLIQLIDSSHCRIGFKAKAKDSWFFSKVFDCSEILKGGISKLGMGTWSTVTGKRWGAQPGSPMYQKILIDYVHYRYGLSAK